MKTIIDLKSNLIIPKYKGETQINVKDNTTREKRTRICD